MEKVYRFVSDPGHGWVEVPVAELVEMGVADKITGYSYRKGNMAYLEEDMDAGTFFNALKAAGVKFKFNEVYEEYTPIRNYPDYY